jgi:hypothetical protein
VRHEKRKPTSFFVACITMPKAPTGMKRPRDTNQLAKANGLHGYALRGEEPRQLMRMVVFNEAHRVRNSRRLEALAREERAFGVGIVIGIQFPGDLLEAMGAIWRPNSSSKAVIRSSRLNDASAPAAPPQGNLGSLSLEDSPPALQGALSLLDFPFPLTAFSRL